MLRSFSAAFALLCQLIMPAAAQDASRSSECLAMTNAPPRATPVSLRSAAAKTDEVDHLRRPFDLLYRNAHRGGCDRPL
jgi:hypothetical protein